MYSIIYKDKNNDQVLYDGKKNTFSLIKSEMEDKNFFDKTPMVSLSGMFIFLNAIVSVVTFNLKVSPLQIIIITYFLAIVSGIFIYMLLKKSLQKKYEIYQVKSDQITEVEVILNEKFSIISNVIKAFIMVIVITLLGTVYIYFNSDKILIIFLVWAMIIISTSVFCELILILSNFSTLKKMFE